MNKKLLNAFEKHVTSEGFIKTADEPVKTLTSEQKVILNRKGNILYNQGDYHNAQRLFITTGYSDGLTRIGDTYMESNKELRALKLYWLAHNKRKCEPLISKTAGLLSMLINEEE